MRKIAILLLALLAGGCVSGPVRQGPVTTQDVQHIGAEEGHKLAELATRNTLARYQSSMARVWTIWQTGEARIRGARPSGDLTPSQAQQWANVQAEQLLHAAEVRDAKLQALDRKRATELGQINQLHANQLSAMNGIVQAWAAQGEITKQQLGAWLQIAQQGAYYVEQKRLEDLRSEAKKAAEAAAQEPEA